MSCNGMKHGQLIRAKGDRTWVRMTSQDVQFAFFRREKLKLSVFLLGKVVPFIFVLQREYCIKNALYKHSSGSDPMTHVV